MSARDENQTLQNALFNSDVTWGLTSEKLLYLVASKKKKTEMAPRGKPEEGPLGWRLGLGEFELEHISHFPTVGLLFLLHSDLK